MSRRVSIAVLVMLVGLIFVVVSKPELAWGIMFAMGITVLWVFAWIYPTYGGFARVSR